MIDEYFTSCLKWPLATDMLMRFAKKKTKKIFYSRWNIAQYFVKVSNISVLVSFPIQHPWFFSVTVQPNVAAKRQNCQSPDMLTIAKKKKCLLRFSCSFTYITYIHLAHTWHDATTKVTDRTKSKEKIKWMANSNSRSYPVDVVVVIVQYQRSFVILRCWMFMCFIQSFSTLFVSVDWPRCSFLYSNMCI